MSIRSSSPLVVAAVSRKTIRSPVTGCSMVVPTRAMRGPPSVYACTDVAPRQGRRRATAEVEWVLRVGQQRLDRGRREDCGRAGCADALPTGGRGARVSTVQGPVYCVAPV